MWLYPSLRVSAAVPRACPCLWYPPVARSDIAASQHLLLLRAGELGSAWVWNPPDPTFLQAAGTHSTTPGCSEPPSSLALNVSRDGFWSTALREDAAPEGLEMLGHGLSSSCL